MGEFFRKLGDFRLVLLTTLSIFTLFTSGYTDLQSIVPVKGSGFGSASTGYSDNGTIFHKNPAGLGDLSDSFFETSYTSIHDNLVKGAHLSGAIQAPFDFKLGITIPLLIVDGILETDESGNETGTFNDIQADIQVVLAKKLKFNIKAGIAANLYRHSLGSQSASSYGIDAGLLGDFKRTTWGVSIQNTFQNKLKWSTGRSEETTRIINTGFSYNVTNPINIMADIAITDGTLVPNAGLSLDLINAFRIEGGISGIGDQNQLRLGAKLKAGNYDINYTWSMQEDLGATHKFGLEVHR